MREGAAAGPWPLRRTEWRDERAVPQHPLLHRKGMGMPSPAPDLRTKARSLVCQVLVDEKRQEWMAVGNPCWGRFL